ncbi:hypothetical protein SPRG_18652 [Saprolegnia parasitica CBS 223.65]|uniref:Uncharacterized protein n=1 Tax=Saprolegnia parasitica (strain CBS 223.65) TaxID=695850 RepID=A0A067BN74_SAPPC|nr:hypothetical protein SPRG_18652 [Saprolegnia parasitica CBS 223.65]KDO15811.1 hypothetical protein SPRG_18652 [Saprolegnia parasitica CBS 223.65]|eukprot:XP_012213480.1 hypothetical protein SPRG_18652 [Saprolegnia parasitica CBS 223.65]
MLTGVPLFSVAARSDKLFRAVHRQGDVLLKMLLVAPSQRMTSDDVVHALEGLLLS